MATSPDLNPDGSFIGGFDGCVAHMMSTEGVSEDSARRICAVIGRNAGKIAERKDDPAAPLPLVCKSLATEMHDTGEVMFVPAGDHTITCGYGPAAATVTIRVDPNTAVVLNASLADLNSRFAPQRACFDKNHEGKEATAWPRSFDYRNAPSPGVYAESEWSSLGKEFVDGKVMRAFSGSFFTDAELPGRGKLRAGQTYTVPAGKRGSAANPARITGLDFPFAGTLTNDPAFTKILPLWAKSAGAGGSPAAAPAARRTSMTPNIAMNKLTPEEKAALQASLAQLEHDIVGLQAHDQNDAQIAESLQARTAERDQVKLKLDLDAAREKGEQLETALLAQRTADAEGHVAAAIKRGAIPAKNEQLQAEWKKRLIEDPSSLSLLNAVRSSPALVTERLMLSGVQMAREDSGTVLRAYHQERDPKKKAAIYARDLSKRIREGEDLPIHASNTLGTLAGEIVTQRTLELLTLEQPQISALSTDFSMEAANFNQDVTSRIVGIPGTTAYNTSTGYATENTVTTDVTVTIDTHKSCQVSFNAQELASTSRRLFDELAPAMAYAIGKDIIDKALALITTANFASTPTDEALIDFDRETVIAIGGALSDRGVPQTGRSLLLTGSYYDKLFSDQTIALLGAQQRQDLITGMSMVPIYGFSILRSPTLPSTGNLTGFGFSKSAIVVSARVPNDYASVLPGATGGGTSQIITNPQSGLSVQLVQFVDHQLGMAFARMAYMFGAALGQANSGQILRSSA